MESSGTFKGMGQGDLGNDYLPSVTEAVQNFQCYSGAYSYISVFLITVSICLSICVIV